MSARRCEIGCQSWPDEPIFTHCTYCGEKTKRVSNIEPDIDRDEAVSVKLHELFEEWYENTYCPRQGIAPEGPLPDDYEIPEPVPDAPRPSSRWSVFGT